MRSSPRITARGQGMRDSKAAALLERAAEVAVLQSALEDAVEHERGSILLVEGDAGIGKTRLLDVAAQEALAGRFRALKARGAEIERDFAFGVVRQLFE